MTDADAELRALQSRAYGREADISRDPAAMRRLADLEASDSSRPVAVSARPDATGAGATTTPAVATEGPVSVVADESAPQRDGSTASHRCRGLFHPAPRTAWIVAACAAVAIGVAASASIAAAVAAAANPTEPGIVDTVAVDTDGEWWDALGEQTDGSVVFDDYFGVTFVRNEGWTEIDDQRCLMALPTEMLDSTGGAITGLGMGCSAGAFPASLQFTVATGSPDPLRERYPDGTSLKFTLRGDTVEVRADR